MKKIFDVPLVVRVAALVVVVLVIALSGVARQEGNGTDYAGILSLKGTANNVPSHGELISSNDLFYTPVQADTVTRQTSARKRCDTNKGKCFETKNKSDRCTYCQIKVGGRVVKTYCVNGFNCK